ncbi:MAG: hypothetical protein HYX56_04465 [Chloroflexi bacterium]|nr:hypothetical protein [Chloroflexota bacterium]
MDQRGRVLVSAAGRGALPNAPTKTRAVMPTATDISETRATTRAQRI